MYRSSSACLNAFRNKPHCTEWDLLSGVFRSPAVVCTLLSCPQNCTVCFPTDSFLFCFCLKCTPAASTIPPNTGPRYTAAETGVLSGSDSDWEEYHFKSIALGQIHGPLPWESQTRKTLTARSQERVRILGHVILSLQDSIGDRRMSGFYRGILNFVNLNIF